MTATHAIRYDRPTITDCKYVQGQYRVLRGFQSGYYRFVSAVAGFGQPIATALAGLENKQGRSAFTSPDGAPVSAGSHPERPSRRARRNKEYAL